MTELPGNRETAYRVFAAEFDDATVEHQESDEERAPNYVVTPTGARVNRLFAVGVLTEVESVNEDVLRARVVDPTGAFVVYAGQYQPDEMAALERLEPPAFVAVTGKANTFSPEDADRVYTSIRPESINVVDAETRDRWVVRTAEHTVDRVGTIAAAADLDATGDGLGAELEARDVPVRAASGAALALEHYGTTPAYLAAVRDLALDAARVVAGDVDEVAGDTPAVDDVGDGSHAYADLAADLGDAGPTATAAATDTATPDADDAEPETTADADAPSAGEAAGADATATDATTSTGDDATADAADATGEDETADAAADDSLASEDPADESAADADEAAVDAEESVGDADETSADGAESAEDGDDEDGVGDFEPGSVGGEATAATDDMYEFDEDEREEIEEEYGTEFSSGNDVPEPEESDLDAPDPDADPGAAGSGDASADADAAPAGDDASESDAGEAVDDADGAAEGDDESAEDVDLDAFVMDAMRELDDGDGVDRDELVDHVVDETGAAADAVDDAVQEALMGGQCYEPDDDVLKPI